jgi:hypothetical protein
MIKSVPVIVIFGRFDRLSTVVTVREVHPGCLPTLKECPAKT